MPLRTSSRQLCVRAIEWLPSTFTPVFSDRTASSTLPRMREPTLRSKRAVEDVALIVRAAEQVERGFRADLVVVDLDVEQRVRARAATSR